MLSAMLVVLSEEDVQISLLSLSAIIAHFLQCLTLHLISGVVIWSSFWRRLSTDNAARLRLIYCSLFFMSKHRMHALIKHTLTHTQMHKHVQTHSLSVLYARLLASLAFMHACMKIPKHVIHTNIFAVACMILMNVFLDLQVAMRSCRSCRVSQDLTKTQVAALPLSQPWLPLAQRETSVRRQS